MHIQFRSEEFSIPPDRRHGFLHVKNLEWVGEARKTSWPTSSTPVWKDPLDSLRGSFIKIGTLQRRSAWPLRKDDTHKSRIV